MSLRSLLTHLVATSPALTVSAHCDLPCGVYDPAQARIDAQSVKACMEKYAASSDADFKTRALIIKEERCEAVKHHLWVLWTDYFKPEHLAAHPDLTTCSGRHQRAQAKPRRPTTSPLPTACWPRLTRLPTSSGQPRSNRTISSPGDVGHRGWLL